MIRPGREMSIGIQWLVVCGLWLMVCGWWLVARTPCLRTLSLWGASGVGRLLIRPICATSGCPILRNCLTSGETFAPCRGFAPSCSSVCPSILSLTVEPVDPHRQYRRSRGRLRPRSAFSRHRLYLQPREGRASARPGKLRQAGTLAPPFVSLYRELSPAHLHTADGTDGGW